MEFGSGELVSSPELPPEIRVLEEEDDFGGRLSSVSSLNLEDEDVVVLSSEKKNGEKGERGGNAGAGAGGGYSPVSSERKSESDDVEEGEIYLPGKRSPSCSSSSSVVSFSKKRKKEPLDVEMSKQQQQQGEESSFGGKVSSSDLPRYDVRNMIKFKKKKRSSHMSLRRPSSPPDTRRHRRRRSSPEHSPIRSRRRSRSREAKVTTQNRRVSSSSKRRRSKDRRSKSPREKPPPPPKRKRKLVKTLPAKVTKSSKKPKKTASSNEKKKAASSKKSSSSLQTPITIVNSHTSSVAAKEVFTEGDKIMVSVNFKPSRVKGPLLSAAPPPLLTMDDDELEENVVISSHLATSVVGENSKKPAVVIDVMSSPYLVIEPSPQETIDILSDEDSQHAEAVPVSTHLPPSNDPCAPPTPCIPAPNSSSSVVVSSVCVVSSNPISSSTTAMSNGGPTSSSPGRTTTPPPIQSTAASSSSGGLLGPLLDILHHRGPCTPPIEESIDVAKGPQTPSDDHSYDPCNPTLSPTCDEGNDDESARDNGVVSSSQNNWTDSEEGKDHPGPTAIIPFFDSGSFFKSAVVACSSASSAAALATSSTLPANTSASEKKDSSKDHLPEVSGSTVDMDMDSPFSPQSSDMSDIFEPPLNTPLTNKLLQKRTKSKQLSNRQGKKQHSSSTTTTTSNNNNNHKTSSKNIHSKSVQMKLIDDKLRIVDDVPTSAVEMAVKEKFLKKVQRQERIVEEIKMVLKPYYNRKKIDKESYKEILRKCVPKVCHSKNGEINPIKIQKLVKGYIRKYKYHSKKGSKGLKG